MFDKRVLLRNIRKGIVTREDYARYLARLADLSRNVVIDSDFDSRVIDDDDDDDERGDS
jgi:hypothetical protein